MTGTHDTPGTGRPRHRLWVGTLTCLLGLTCTITSAVTFTHATGTLTDDTTAQIAALGGISGLLLTAAGALLVRHDRHDRHGHGHRDAPDTCDR